MKRAACSFALMLSLCACGQDDSRDKRLAALEQDVASLREQVRVDQARITQMQVAAASPPKQAAELVVTWPEKGGNDYRRPFASLAECEKAREAVFSENERRQSAADAHAKATAPPGYTLLAAGQQPAASAVCIVS